MLVKPDQPARWLWYAAIVLLVIVGAALGFKTQHISEPSLQLVAALDPDCDLRAGPCVSPLSDGRSVSFSIEPRSIPPLVPLLLRVDTIGFDAREVRVSLNGVGMQMGFNQVDLGRHPQGYFSATGSLSVCIRDVMEWEAVVTVVSEDMWVSAPYRFITTKNAARH